MPVVGHKPVGNKNLVRDRSGEDIAHYFDDAKRIVLPEARHLPHNDQWKGHEKYADSNHGAGATVLHRHQLVY